jgi:hypothetical protein
MSRQVLEVAAGVAVTAGVGVVAALTETETPPTETLAAAAVGATVTPTATFAAPAETFAAMLAEPLWADTSAVADTPPPDDVAVGEVATETLAPVDEEPEELEEPEEPEEPEDPEVPDEPEEPDEPTEPEEPDEPEVLVVPGALEVPEVLEVPEELEVPAAPEPLELLEVLDPDVALREVSATPPAPGRDPDPDPDDLPECSVLISDGDDSDGEDSGVRPRPVPPMTGGAEGPPDGRCSMRTDTEVSRNKTMSVASPNIGTMLPAGWSRTMAARLRVDLRTLSSARANASCAAGSRGFWPRRAAWCRRRSTALR